MPRTSEGKDENVFAMSQRAIVAAGGGWLCRRTYCEPLSLVGYARVVFYNFSTMATRPSSLPTPALLKPNSASMPLCPTWEALFNSLEWHRGPTPKGRAGPRPSLAMSTFIAGKNEGSLFA